MTFKSHSSYGVHIVNHLTADATCLACGEVTVVTLIERYSYFACCLHLELLKSLLSILVCHNVLLFILRIGRIF